MCAHGIGLLSVVVGRLGVVCVAVLSVGVRTAVPADKPAVVGEGFQAALYAALSVEVGKDEEEDDDGEDGGDDGVADIVAILVFCQS